MPKTFISYRRDDSSGHAGRLYDHLTGHFGQGQVFMDVDAIQPGLHFVEVIQAAVSACDVLIAVIGSDWLQISDASGSRRLDDPADLVRLEIATALERGIPVIPVLVRGAQMPREADLPIVLTDLAFRNALEVSDARFRSDVERLIEALEAPAQDRLAETVFVEPAQLASSTFVGRDREMGELNAALEASLAGQGRLVMLVGEPGIGKTRTAQELASRAERRGAQVLWGRCIEEEGAPPYWPWVQAIRSYVQQTNAEQLQSEMGPGAADIAESFPELREKLPGLKPSPALEPEQARFRLFDSITSFLKNAAQSRPTMLVLEDLHWADKPSLLLLQFLAREMAASRLLLVCTCRDVALSRQHPLSEALAQLSRESVFRRQPLGGLSQEFTPSLIQAVTGILPSQAVAETIFAHAEGNPYFMTEIIRLLSERGELTEEGIGGSQGLRLPDGVRGAIGQRLNRMSEEANQVLTTASVIGREFSLRLLERLMDSFSEDRLLDVVEEALGARVIEELAGPGERYQFSHGLVQETLASGLSAARRVRLHARIGEALEAQYGGNAPEHAAELAHHFAQAEAVLGIEKLVTYSHLAGERALAAYAWEDGLAHFQRGLAAKKVPLTGTEPAPDADAAAFLFGLGRAQAATRGPYQQGETVESMRRAFEYFAQAGNIPLAVDVAEYPASRGGEMGEFISKALTMVSPDSHEAGRLLSRHGLVLGRAEGDYDGAQEAFSRALAIARREGDEALEMRTSAVAADVAYMHLRHEECLQRSLRTIDLAQRIDDPRAEVTARFFAVGAYYTRGNLEEAGRHATEVLPVAEKLRDQWLPNALWRNDIVSHLAGDWRSAREFSDRGLAISGQPGLLLCTRVLLEYEMGEFGQGEAYLNRLVEAMGLASPASTDYAFSTAVLLLADRITGGTKWTDVAAEAATRVVAAARPHISILSARAALGLVAALRDEADSAGEQYQFLQQYPGIVLPGVLRSVDRLLGILSQTMGNLDQAAAHFEDALTFCRQAGYRPELAWSCSDYADLLRERDAEGDRAKAMSLLDESLAISTELGMRPLMERVLSRREILRA